MKKIFIPFFLFFLHLDSFSQLAEKKLQQISLEKNESLRMELIIGLFELSQETDPLQDMQHAKMLLKQSYDMNDRISEAMALSEIGYAYKSIGDLTEGLNYNLQAMEVAEESGNELLEAYVKINLATCYKELANYREAASLLEASDKIMESAKQYKLQTWALMNLAQVHASMHHTDSALMFAQRAYELCIRIGYTEYIGYICNQLGKVHTTLGNLPLAENYFRMAITDAESKKSPKYRNLSYYWFADFFLKKGQADSAVFYSTKAIDAVNKSDFFTMNLLPARLLSQLYEGKNNDSTVKYLKLYLIANDSLLNISSVQQTQVLTFENNLKHQQKEQERNEAERKRRENIQFVLMALGIILIFLSFLILSRRFISNEKTIEYFGIIALLLVFEFINLLLHPFLTSITHHSPPLMLLALVCIAALLAPLHHRAEKWATEKMVEKNRILRLAAAKKTISALESKNTEKDI